MLIALPIIGAVFASATREHFANGIKHLGADSALWKVAQQVEEEEVKAFKAKKGKHVTQEEIDEFISKKEIENTTFDKKFTTGFHYDTEIADVAKCTILSKPSFKKSSNILADTFEKKKKMTIPQFRQQIKDRSLTHEKAPWYSKFTKWCMRNSESNLLSPWGILNDFTDGIKDKASGILSFLLENRCK
jgi:aerobic-type carbon monoxide dehydrogenase small subunit (CoxS/CutS family)